VAEWNGCGLKNGSSILPSATKRGIDFMRERMGLPIEYEPSTSARSANVSGAGMGVSDVVKSTVQGLWVKLPKPERAEGKFSREGAGRIGVGPVLRLPPLWLRGFV
jgi:hypothetical protein